MSWVNFRDVTFGVEFDDSFDYVNGSFGSGSKIPFENVLRERVVESDERHQLLNWLYLRLLKRAMFCKRKEIGLGYPSYEERVSDVDVFDETLMADAKLMEKYNNMVGEFEKLDFISKILYFAHFTKNYFVDFNTTDVYTDSEIFREMYDSFPYKEYNFHPDDDFQEIAEMVGEQLDEKKCITLRDNILYLLSLDSDTLTTWQKVCIFEGVNSVGDRGENLNGLGELRRRDLYTGAPFIKLEEIDIDEFISSFGDLPERGVDDSLLDQLLTDFAFGKYWDNLEREKAAARGGR